MVHTFNLTDKQLRSLYRTKKRIIDQHILNAAALIEAGLLSQTEIDACDIVVHSLSCLYNSPNKLASPNKQATIHNMSSCINQKLIQNVLPRILFPFLFHGLSLLLEEKEPSQADKN